MMDIRKYSSMLDNKCVAHLFMQPEQKKKYQEILSLISKHGDKGENIYYGMRYAHVMYALTNEKPQYYSSFWMLQDDYEELKTVVSLMKKDKKLVFFDFTHSDENFFAKEGLVKIETSPYCTIYKTK